jgi:tetratricopeptide (TPR) repeat protein
MSAPDTKAVFLSYASQDAESAKRIAEALRAAGVEVWFDQNELVGGDAWDQKIRRQIKECTLFVPLISANTNARAEGYFRLEWKLAVDRSHLMADDMPFLFPIVVGDVSDATARVPDKFRDVQWTRLRLDETPVELATRVTRLLGGEQGAGGGEQADGKPGAEDKAERKRRKRDGKPAWLRHAWPVIGLIIVFNYVIRPMFRSRDGGEGRAESNAPKMAEQASPTPPPPAEAPKSEARRLAERGFALSVDNFDSTQDDFAVAEDLLKRALALGPDDGEIWAYSAQLNFMFRNRGFDFAPERIATGRQQAERAVRLAPDSPEAVFAVALAHRYTNNEAGYIETMQRVVALNPAHARALMFLGGELTRRGETMEEGLALLARARENPKWAPLVDYFAFLRNFFGREFAAAEAAIRDSQSSKPSANSAAAIAVLHMTWKGDLEAASRLLAGLPPALLTAPRVVWATAELHMLRRDPERALRTLDRLPDEYLSSSWYTGPKAYLVGRAHALAGREAAARIDWEKALGLVEQKLKTEPGDPVLHRSRGEILACLGRTDEALAEARTVSEIHRGQTTGWPLSEVAIYAVLGRADLALPILERQLGMSAGWPLTAKLLQTDPRWDKLRGEPGFITLLEQHSPPESPK